MLLKSTRFYGFAACLLWLTLSLASCGAKRQVAYKPKPNTGKVMSDASDARGVELGKSKMENYANILGVSVKELNNKSLYNFVDEWMGSPHKMGGALKSGIDCSKFVGILYEQVYRANLPRRSEEMGEKVKRKYERDLKEGDLIFFSFGGKGIDHVGVYLKNNKFVHVSSKRGVIISNIKDSWYYKYFVRAGTPKI